ncbi:MAG: SDR family NAD(P)-dependent oxidoreductase [Clostridia bacterium]|nr:SDR family NAD(P)-dependent oxidoreductase [Clostridia bacterium]
MARYLVTGANGGMGGAICRALTDAGHEAVGFDIIKPPAETPWRVIRADVTDSASLEAAFAALGEEKLDGVIHAAGIYDLGSLVEMDEAAFIRAFNVNLFGVYRVNKLAVPLLNNGARILIITSELAPLDPLPFTGIYAVTKSALEKYAYSLRMELQLLGCKVAVVRPGAVKTDMLPASVGALGRFCAGTKLYPVNAGRFKRIVERVEAQSVTPEKLAGKVLRVLKKKRPRFAYSINRNPLLLMLNALPRRMQFWIIRKVLS